MSFTVISTSLTYLDNFYFINQFKMAYFSSEASSKVSIKPNGREMSTGSRSCLFFSFGMISIAKEHATAHS